MQDSDVIMVLTALLLAVAVVTLGVTVWHWWSKRNGSVIDPNKVPLPEIGPFDGQDVECTCKDHCARHDRIPESVVVGSNFTRVSVSKIPKVQVAVFSVDNDGRLVRYLGVATRMLDWLVVPYHVVVAEDVVGVLTSGEKPMAMKIKTDRFDLIDGDVAAARLSEADFSRLGLFRAGIASIEGEMMVSICSSSKEPEISFGVLTNDSKVFGGVVFRGSTRGGFSGAPYMVGKQIAGIHLGGGVMNYGVSASYVVALLAKPEDTAEWLQSVRRRGGRVKYLRSKFNPDEAIVFVNGRYHTVDLSLLEGDEEEAYEVKTALREPEVNLSESFPPQYQDMARPIVTAVSTITAELQSKNAELAEQCSADEADLYMKKHAEMMSQLDEKIMLLQSLQDSVSNRYREVQRLITQVPKDDRQILVEENEKLKWELTEIKKLKTDVNVESSSVKAIPKSVRKARAKAERATMMDRLAGQGFRVDDVVQALVEAGLVQRAEQHAGNAATTSVSAAMKPVQKSMSSLPVTPIKWSNLAPDSEKNLPGQQPM